MSIFKEDKINSKLSNLGLNDEILLQVDQCYRKAMRMIGSSGNRLEMRFSCELLKAIDKDNKVIQIIKVIRIK